MRSLAKGNKVIESALVGFLKTKPEQLELFRRYFGMQETLLEEYVAILTLMENAYGSYQYDDEGVVMFVEDADLITYNEVIMSMLAHAVLEQEWSDEVVASELKFTQKIRSHYE